MSPLELHLQNDLDGLQWIHKFGWLRTVELGQFLWAGNASARHQADRLARSWLRRRLVIARPLPYRAGRALVLATAGVRLLAEHRIAATSGKDWGETAGKAWCPPASWKHDLHTAGLLADLYVRGFDVLPEQHIRRHTSHLMKLPDGIVTRGDQVVWVETEAARKTGPSMRALVDALCSVTDGTAAPILGLKPTHVMVGFSPKQRDERGHALSHRGRLSRALAAVARQAVPLTWASCTMRGVGLDSVTYADDLIETDRAAAVLRRLDASGWRPETGVLVSNYGQRRALVWEDDDAGAWAWQVDDLPAARVATVSEAKRRCAEQLVALAR